MSGYHPRPSRISVRFTPTSHTSSSLPLRHYLSPSDIPQISPSFFSLPSNPTSQSSSSGSSPQPAISLTASSSSSTTSSTEDDPSSAETQRTRRKGKAEKSPEMRHAEVRLISDVAKIIDLANKEDAHLWKGAGNERSTREWVGNGRASKSQHLAGAPPPIPAPTPAQPAKRSRTRAATPNGMPKPLTTHANSTTQPNTHLTGTSHASTSTAMRRGGSRNTSTNLGAIPEGEVHMTRQRSSNGAAAAASASASSSAHSTGIAIAHQPTPLSALPALVIDDLAMGSGLGRGLPPSPLRETAGSAAPSEEDEAQEGSEVGRKRKRPWDDGYEDSVASEADEGDLEEGGPGGKKARRGSEPSRGSPTSKAKGKRATTHSPPMGNAVPGDPPSSAPPISGQAFLSVPPTSTSSSFAADHFRDVLSSSSAKRSRSTMSADHTNPRTRRPIHRQSSMQHEVDFSGPLDGVGFGGGGEGEDAVAMLAGRGSLGGGGRQGGDGVGAAPMMRRVVSTDGYGGRTRRAPASLRDYEMKVKV